MKSFEKEFAAAKPQYEYLLRSFRDALNVEEVTWDMLTMRNLVIIRDYLLSKKASNSVHTYCAVFKAFLAQFEDAGVLPCGDKYGKALKVKKTPSDQIVLTEDEIARIEMYRPKTTVEREIKAQFLCEYYCMARQSDIMAMTKENIDLDSQVISYVSIKTKKKAVIPMHKNFLEYFSQRGSTHTRHIYNYCIKNICKRCGIDEPIKAFYRGKEQILPKYEMVGSHTARRSAATHLAAHGAPIVAIAQMMNHGTNIRQTQGYIYATPLNLSEDTMAFFK